jgi:5-methylcytosine-specific restriction endonuclease McrA
MPFAGYENFDACVQAQKQKGKSDVAARSICGALQRDLKGKNIQETVTERKLRRSKFQPTGTWIRPESRQAIYKRDNFKCQVCGEDLSEADPENITLDHIVQRKDGGGNDASNLRTCCRPCNCGKRGQVVKSAVYKALISYLLPGE